MVVCGTPSVARTGPQKPIRPAIVLGWLAVAAVSGCGTVSTPPPGSQAATAFVIDRGWHTDIGIGVEEVHGPLITIEQSFPGVRYLVFGFGDRAYLLARHRTLLDMVGAVLPGPGAMLVTALRAPPTDAFGAEHVIGLPLSQAQLDRLTGFIWNNLQKNSRGLPLVIADGPYPGSIFYASSATYDVAYTCNTWTADALYVAGLPVSPDGVVFASQLMRRVRSAAQSLDTRTAPNLQAVGDRAVH
jgi:Protein of unknown function (DUF2459)